ncbi:hypothetical protein [Trueperella bialowiezensis]|uniref:hypothetical protein n=1 Tax=Trueperella bialowiezensis TaxID=312285 RepID=UPI000F81EE58|nr:hypothetical protein [Trueperella bialowiezensis]
MSLQLSYVRSVVDEGHIFNWVIQSQEDGPFAVQIELAAFYQSKNGWDFPSEDDASVFYVEVVLPVLHQAVERVHGSLWGLFGVRFRLLPELSFCVRILILGKRIARALSRFLVFAALGFQLCYGLYWR